MGKSDYRLMQPQTSTFLTALDSKHVITPLPRSAWFICKLLIISRILEYDENYINLSMLKLLI